MRIDVISDTVCPWCFIGKRRLERALAERPDLEPEIVWHPFQLNPDMPAEGLDRQRYLELKFGGTTRAREVYRMVAEAGNSENLDFQFDAIQTTPNTILSHRLLHFAQKAGLQDTLAEALFRAYFFDGRNIGDLEILADIAAENGMDRDEIHAYLSSDSDEQAVTAEDVRARKMGVTGVPCFIINGRYAISGAQDPEVFQQVFSVAEQEEENESVPELAESVT